jgi:hypothetical protein
VRSTAPFQPSDQRPRSIGPIASGSATAAISAATAVTEARPS